jgi:hypothetical protein
LSQTDSDQALARADKLIEKGSFLAAKAELQKLLGVRGDPNLGAEVQQKLQQCDLALRKQQAKEWVKRGRKSEKRGKLADALAAFEQARVLAEEPWMAQRISDLQAESEKQALAAQARTAEKAGDWQAASRLYAAAGAEAAGQDARLKQARNRLEAGDYAAAAELYASSTPLSERDRYDWGYCCYRLRQFAACLKTWDELSLSSPELAEQRDAVQGLLCEQVLTEFSCAKEPSLELQPLVAYLHEIRPTEETQAALDFYFLRRIETCWREKRLETLLHVLAEEVALVSAKIHQHPRLIEVYAKTSFELAEASAEHLPLFGLYYLTAVYRKRFSSRSAEEKIKPDEIRAMLIQLGGELVDSYRKSPERSIQYRVSLWHLEKDIIAELSSILPKNRVAVSEAICTPQFAWRFGCGSPVLSLLDQNRHRACDLKTYLALGAYFTSYGPSLYALQLGGEEPAEASPPKAEPRNEFERFAQSKLCFADGLKAIRAKQRPPRRFFQAALELFSQGTEDESRFLALALKEEDPEQVDQYVEVLKQLCRARPQGEAREVLSRLMSERAIRQFSAGEISLKVFRNVLHQALEWDPGNEGARGALEDARLERELEDLNRAFYRHKNERLCQIVRDTEFEEVRDEFWKLLGSAVAGVPTLAPEHRSVALWELKRCALMIDPGHRLLLEIDRMLARPGENRDPGKSTSSTFLPRKGNPDHEPL